ncbi:MAG: hypothetical protein ACTSPV_03810 [Candidatus Hodarchaeales archaeon]
MMKEDNLTDSLEYLQELLAPKEELSDLKLPLDEIVSKYLVDSVLSPTEQKIYFQFAIEFQIILNKTSSYHEALYRWELILDDRLQEYGLTRDSWNKIKSRADKDSRVKLQHDKLLRKINHILEN